MKLAVRNISKSESHVTGSVSIDSNLLWTTFPFCSFQVCVDRVDGKSLEQYESDLLEVARERIAEIYKEIVCGGKMGEAIDLVDYLSRKIEPSELSKETLEQIHSAQSNNDLGGRIAALEKHLGEQTSPDMLKTIHEVGTVRLQVSECEEYSVGFPFRITEKCGQLFVHDEEGVRPPTHKHRDVIIDRVIRDLKSENGNMLKCLGRCMGLLQVAAEIEAVSQMCESKCKRCRESILSDFDNPPFKNVPTGWISPGVKYLKRRI
ncbi:hypothetical protein AAB98_002893 [Salmonella enterica subsp. enterica]|uniref:Uncharacterized protein n=1 Tax=Salmonella enterica TaxID=28901 RepID=A0A760ZS24_SALER|nr:hypothetical protein [Salmonella enterica]ECE6543575.1 hypothetical protein [Salmonella enterica subsp. enterica]EDN4789335.1 hypothetical protein [Salmonella enterica subsp. enterica]EDY0745442.1 hypothetical protein [Salmonella enterica subsp. enterica]HAG2749604.1 hypothetical protein [Salmonella enterica]